MKRSSKRVAAGVLALSMVPGMMPGNVATLISESGISIVHATEAKNAEVGVKFFDGDTITFENPMLISSTSVAAGTYTINAVPDDAAGEVSFTFDDGSTETEDAVMTLAKGGVKGQYYGFIINNTGTNENPVYNASVFGYSNITKNGFTSETTAEVSYVDTNAEAIDLAFVDSTKDVKIISTEPFVLRGSDSKITEVHAKKDVSGKYVFTGKIEADTVVDSIKNNVLINCLEDAEKVLTELNAGNFDFAPTLKLAYNITALADEESLGITHDCKLDLNGNMFQLKASAGWGELKLTGCNVTIMDSNENENAGTFICKGFNVDKNSRLILNSGVYAFAKGVGSETSYDTVIPNSNEDPGTILTRGGYYVVSDPSSDDDGNEVNHYPVKYFDEDDNAKGNANISSAITSIQYYVEKAIPIKEKVYKIALKSGKSLPVEVNNGTIKLSDDFGYQDAISATLTFRNGKSVTYDKDQLDYMFNGELVAEKGTRVELLMKNITIFNYDNGDGFTINPAPECVKSEAGYTYTFDIPGFTVEHVSEKHDIIFNNDLYGATVKLYDNPVTLNSTDAVTINHIADKPVIIESSVKLQIEGVDAQNINEQYIDGKFRYTFTMPSVNVTVSRYVHAHEFTYALDDAGNALIATCINTDDNSCSLLPDEQKKKVAELEVVSKVYDGTACTENVWYYDSITEAAVIHADPGAVEYYKADAWGNPTGVKLVDKPVDAGKYVAVLNLTKKINTNDYIESDEIFTLKKVFEITPKPLTADDIIVESKKLSEYEESETCSLNTADGKFVGPTYKVTIGSSDLTLGRDYYSSGQTYENKTTGENETYKFTVHGIGNYKGNVDVEWKLTDTTAKKLTSDMISVSTTYVNGCAMADVSVAGCTSSDFTVIGPRFATEAGNYKIKVEGKSASLYGVAEADWEVAEYGISGKNAVLNSVKFADGKLSFSSKMSVSKNETQSIEEVGIIATKNKNIKYDLTVNTTPDTANGMTYVKRNTSAAGRKAVGYTWNKSSVKNGDVWYTRSFVTYKEGDEKVTVYGDLMKVTVTNGVAVAKKVDTASVKLVSSGYKEYSPEDNKLTYSFKSNINVPEGCKISKVGVIATSDSATATAANGLTLSTRAVSGVTFVKSNTQAAGKTSANYVWNKSAVAVGATWYIRPYVMYTDEDGVSITIYGDQVDVTTVAPTYVSD